MIYIDFDGVILDTETYMFQEWRKKENRNKLSEKDKIEYLKNVDWKYVLKKSKPINNSINYLRLMNPKNTFILTKIHSLEEGIAKIEWVKEHNLKHKTILVPYYLNKNDFVSPSGNVLIDDCLKNLNEWKKENGIVVFFDKNNSDCDSWHQKNINNYTKINDLSMFVNNDFNNVIILEQYRDIWMSQKFDEVIGFYPREFYPLDNFSSFKVEYNGYLYSSAEEAFQANLFIDNYPEIAEEIKNSHSAHEAQKIRFKYENKIKLNSNEILELMEKILRCKIEQNPYVLKKLLETKDYTIVEDSPKDNYWGWGINRDGENRLGKIWMKLREEYKNKSC